MNDPILITYASRHGATASIAQAIGRTLIELGRQVDVQPMTDVTDLAPYRAVIAGSAIQGQKWLPEAIQFVQIYQAALSQKPFAAFLVCITLGMPNAARYRDGISAWMKPVRSLVTPRSEALFAGRLEPGEYPRNFSTLKLRLAVALGALPKGDYRDWTAVDAWARSLTQTL